MDKLFLILDCLSEKKKENKRSGARVESGCTAGKHCNHRDEKCLSSKISPESRVVLNL